MKKIKTQDCRTNEILNIEYNYTNKLYRFNGIEVLRNQPLESSGDELVFSPNGSGELKLYHVLKDDIKMLWTEN
jgi:hypothetical protein